MSRRNFWSTTPELWQAWATEHQVSDHLLRLILRFFWKAKNLQLPPWVQEKIKQDFDFALPTVVHAQHSPDGTVKFLLALTDNQSIETVIVPFAGRTTLCLSTQVGCAMACRFCHTAKQGLKRHLSAAEIVGQYWVAWQWLKINRPENLSMPKIVFMGQGEPLHNFDQLKQAIEIFLHPQMLALGPRNITVSTVGYIPGLERLDELPLVNLALSLHSPFDQQRSQLIPVNARYPLEKVLSYFDRRPRLKGQYINFEYLLIEGINDSQAHLDELARLIRPRPGIVNIIPYNSVPDLPWRRPSFEQAHQFQKQLRARQVYATVRTTKGEDIMAACGQLNSLYRQEAHA